MYEITDIRERSHLLYLAQSDSHLRTFMPKRSSLMRDLATRLLLEPGVVITDSYFLDSAEIAGDIKRYHESLIWHGLKRGLIIPAFRTRGVQSFDENRRRGVMPTTTIGIRNDAEEVANLLDAAVKGSRTPKITWPDGVGISFGKLMSTQFIRESTDSDSWGVKERALWKQSKDLRDRYLNMGWQREPNPEVTGLRRGTIFKAIAADLRFSGDPSNTLGIIGNIEKGRRAALRATILWIDELYNYNQASQYKVRPYFPVGKGPGAFMTPGLLWQGTSRVSSPLDVSSFSHDVRWPSYRMLRHTSPDLLLGLRTDESGQAYIKSMKDFHRKPNDVNWADFKFAINRYASDVCRAVGSDVRSGLAVRYIRAGSGITLGLIVGTLAGTLIPGLAPTLVAASAVSGALASAYTPVGDLVTEVAMGRKVTIRVNRGDFRIDLPVAMNIQVP